MLERPDAPAAPLEMLREVDLLVFDFDGVFTDNVVYVFEDGREAVRCTRADGLGLAKLRKLGIPMLIVSTERNPVVSMRAAKLRLECIQDCSDKCLAVTEAAKARSVPLSRTAFVGNDINDLPALRAVGIPIVVRDAHEDVIPIAKYRTRAFGGQGAVREICDLIAAAKAPDL